MNISVENPSYQHTENVKLRERTEMLMVLIIECSMHSTIKHLLPTALAGKSSAIGRVLPSVCLFCFKSTDL